MWTGVDTHLVGDVGTHKHRHVDGRVALSLLHLLLQQVGDQHRLAVLKLDALDQRDADGVG